MANFHLPVTCQTIGGYIPLLHIPQGSIEIRTTMQQTQHLAQLEPFFLVKSGPKLDFGYL